jgi:hypothetical protein
MLSTTAEQMAFRLSMSGDRAAGYAGRASSCAIKSRSTSPSVRLQKRAVASSASRPLAPAYMYGQLFRSFARDRWTLRTCTLRPIELPPSFVSQRAANAAVSRPRERTQSRAVQPHKQEEHQISSRRHRHTPLVCQNAREIPAAAWTRHVLRRRRWPRGAFPSHCKSPEVVVR